MPGGLGLSFCRVSSGNPGFFLEPWLSTDALVTSECWVFGDELLQRGSLFRGPDLEWGTTGMSSLGASSGRRGCPWDLGLKACARPGEGGDIEHVPQPHNGIGDLKRAHGVFPLLLLKELQKLAAQHSNVRILPLDMENVASIQEAFLSVTDQLKGLGLNLLINNAGRAFSDSIHTESEENMHVLYQIHVSSNLKICQTFLPLLKKAAQTGPQDALSCSRAAIINMSSTAGSISELLGWELGPCLSYRCSKAALNMLTRCLGLALKKEGILCVAIHPGWVQTDMGTSSTFKVSIPPACISLSLGPFETENKHLADFYREHIIG
uniref:C-factor n=1 Tax=Sarcophilus harrisii TaxID=9305 RepID=A0A7N4NQV6_SARHA